VRGRHRKYERRRGLQANKGRGGNLQSMGSERMIQQKDSSSLCVMERKRRDN
jgi:hypothetical protein